MKTFTLRLTDIEAEALERLAALCKQSKNQWVKQIITDEYLTFDSWATCVDEELEGISHNSQFPFAIIDPINSMEETDKATIAALSLFSYRAARYILANYDDTLIEEEKKNIEKLVERLKDEVK